MITYPLGSLTQLMAMSNTHGQTAEDRASMNLGFTFDLPGELDKAKLERAIGRLTSEKIMNTGLIVDGMQLTAAEKEAVPFRLETVKVTGETVEEKIAKVKKEAESIAIEPMPLTDLSAQTYFFRLYEIAEDHHILFMLVHHAFLDFGSVMIAVCHIFGYYNNEDYQYPQCREFSDFMKNELEFMASDQAKAENDYWESEMADLRQPPLKADPLTENDALLTEQDLMAVFSRKELNEIASKFRTSTFNLIMLMVQMALAKANDCNDTIVQYAISNRSEIEYRYTLGCITRLLFNRMDFDDDMNVAELNKLVRKKMGAGYQNRGVAGKMSVGMFSYLFVNEDMNDLDAVPVFNGRPVQLEFVDMPRTVDFVAFLMLPLGEDHIGVGTITDIPKYGKHAKIIVEALQLAKRFVMEYPDRPFSDFMRQDITIDTLSLLDEKDSVEIIEL